MAFSSSAVLDGYNCNKIFVRFLPAVLVLPCWLTISLQQVPSSDDAVYNTTSFDDGEEEEAAISSSNVFLLVSSVQNYYPLMIAMILGSLIAGSTPLGGGVVAFPVSVLLIGFTSSQGRDFSLMIQSIGMTAATYMILLTKSDIIKQYGYLLAKSMIFSLIGLIIGTRTTISSFVVTLIYTTLVSAFAIVLAYVENFLVPETKTTLDKQQQQRTESEIDQNNNKDNNEDTIIEQASLSAIVRVGEVVTTINCTDIENQTTTASSSSSVETKSNDLDRSDDPGDDDTIFIILFWDWFALIAFNVVGGFASSQIGSGADIMWYAYCSLVHNAKLRRRNRQQKKQDDWNNNISNHQQQQNDEMIAIMNGNELTATSVIMMATMSVFGTILRMTTVPSSSLSNTTTMVNNNWEVYQALIACAPIVVVGAPLGSLFLTPYHQRKLKVLFYVLTFVQFISFAIIKIKTDAVAWYFIGGFLGGIIAIIIGHYCCYCRN